MRQRPSVVDVVVAAPDCPRGRSLSPGGGTRLSKGTFPPSWWRGPFAQWGRSPLVVAAPPVPTGTFPPHDDTLQHPFHFFCSPFVLWLLSCHPALFGGSVSMRREKPWVPT